MIAKKKIHPEKSHKINRLWKLHRGFHCYYLKALLSNIKKSLLQYQNSHNNNIKTPLNLFLQGYDLKIHKKKTSCCENGS